jgi:MFS family permease
MTLFIQKELILGGRILYGLATGFIAVAMPRYMDEILPPSLIGLYGGLYCFSFAIATIIAYLLALGLPSDKINGKDNT